MRASDAASDEEAAPFRCEIAWVDRRVLRVAYAGRVPPGDRHVRRAQRELLSAEPPVGLCYDLRELVGFDRSQVALHAQSLSRAAAHVSGIALVGARPAARFGAVTVSLVSRLPLATFDDLAEALAWLRRPHGREALALARTVRT